MKQRQLLYVTTAFVTFCGIIIVATIFLTSVHCDEFIPIVQILII